ncbi:cytochrome c oxidase assembly protein CtaG [Gracilibacillus halophilus YIM-C55.5]|uniref:Cytochrome c oxidase assembly protein CtaG n=1 Tax=Gracilibacillus halophilus YIM-C55.5 TaxID=1308866 RepID=N4WVD9_9BACI|nr:cytochrome c oxidase assembly factor CtaG [Gracilibacillus halophilus]ENH98355.1 cytochrome c oxidase assembly protein CtaG [Gracilibacillus halophilus YIM-C55.5]
MLTDLEIFGFRALWSPYYMVFIMMLGIVYYFLFIRRKSDKKANQAQITAFYTGLLLLYIIKGSPIDLMSHIMFTAHMIQLGLYYMIFPILIIKGIPKWAWEAIFFQPLLKPMLHLLTKPLIAIILFNGVFSVYHIPVVFDFVKEDEIIHAAMSVCILVTAFFMWWPIFTPIKSMDTMSPLLKIGYMAANGLLITPACALLIFSNISVYDTYSASGSWLQALALCVPTNVLSDISLNGPEMFSPMSIVEDQQLGGIVMKIGQEIVYGSVIASIFFPWFREGADKVDPLPSEQNSNIRQT